MDSRLRAALLAPLLLAWLAAADLDVYVDDALSSGWQNWSWGTTLNTAATDLKKGISSLSVTSDAWSALSLMNPSGYSTYKGFQFDFAGDPSAVQVRQSLPSAKGCSSHAARYSFTSKERRTTLSLPTSLSLPSRVSRPPHLPPSSSTSVPLHPLEHLSALVLGTVSTSKLLQTVLL